MDWVDGTDLATLLARARAPGARAVERARLPGAGGRGAHAPALADRRRSSTATSSRQPHPHHAAARIKLVDFGLSSAPNVPLPARRDARLPRAGAGRRRRAVARERRLRARRHRVRAADRRARRRACCPAGRASTPAQAEQLEAAIRLGHGDRSGAPSADRRASWSSGCGPAGRQALPDRRDDVLPLRHRRLDRAVGRRPGGDGRGARAPRRADRRRRRRRTAAASSSRWARATRPSRCSTRRRHAVAAALAANARAGGRAWPGDLRSPSGWGLHTGEAERRGADYFGPTRQPRRAPARRRPTAARSSCPRSPPSSSPGTCPRAARSSTSARIGCGAWRARAGPRARGAGRARAAAATECPYRGLLAFEAGRPPLLLRPRGRSWPSSSAGSRPAGCSRSSARRAAASPRCCAPASSPRRAPGEVAGIDARRAASRPAPRRALDVDGRAGPARRRRPVRGAVHALRRRGRRRAFIDALLALRGAGRRSACAPTSTAARATTPSSPRAVADNQVLLGPMSDDELERAITEPARLAGLRLEPGLVELIAARRRRRARRAAAALARAARDLGAARRPHAHGRRATARAAASRRRSPARPTASSTRCPPSSASWCAACSCGSPSSARASRTRAGACAIDELVPEGVSPEPSRRCSSGSPTRGSSRSTRAPPRSPTRR